jgi:hypothetical protein
VQAVKLNVTGLKFIKDFGLACLYLIITFLWLGMWAMRAARSKHTAARTPEMKAHNKPLENANRFNIVGWSLLAGWLGVLTFYEFASFDFYTYTGVWQNPFVVPGALLASVIMIVILHPWRRFSFWLALTGAAALETELIRRGFSDQGVLRAIGVIAFILWSLLVIGARGARSGENQPRSAPRQNGKAD